MANFYNSPGIRVREFDQSIVTPLQSRIPTRGVIFIQSDWGPEWQLCESNKDFIRNFGLPSDVSALEDLSYDQQYKLVGTLPLYVFRLNTGQGQTEQSYTYTEEGSGATQVIGSGDSEIEISVIEVGEDGNDYTVEVVVSEGVDDQPMSVDLTDEQLTITLGVDPYTPQSQTIGSGDNAISIETLNVGDQMNVYTVEVVLGSGIDIPAQANLVGTQLTITLGTDGTGSLDPLKNAQNLIEALIDQVTDGVDPVFAQTQQGTDPLTTAEGPTTFTGGSEDVVSLTKNTQDLIQQEIETILDGGDQVFEQLAQGIDPIDTQEGPTSFDGGVDDIVVVPFSQKHTGTFGNDLSISLEKSVLDEYTFTTYLSGVVIEIYKAESLVDLQQQVGDYSQYVNLHYDAFEILEEEILQATSTPVDLDGGTNGQTRSPSFYWEQGTSLDGRLDFMGLSNKNQYQYRFVIGQGQLDETESNTFQGYQSIRKDFVVLTEFLPDSQDYTDWINDSKGQMNVFMRGIANDPASYMSGYADNSYLQVYHPWVMENALGGSLLPYPPSVKVMQAFGTMIATGRIWDAAQGISRGKLNVEPYMILNEDQKDLLYKSSVNPIVKFAGEGTFIWGQKTALTAQSQLNRLNQRLASIEVESTIDWQMREYIFEPLIQLTFDNIEARLDGILTNFVNTNAIIQYKYELDASPQYIDNNYIIINVQFIPTKSLEFIELRFIVKNYSQTL